MSFKYDPYGERIQAKIGRNQLGSNLAYSKHQPEAVDEKTSRHNATDGHSIQDISGPSDFVHESTKNGYEEWS